jgi:hypothetical protein
MAAVVIATLGAENYGLLFLVFYGAPLIVPVADPFAGRATSYWLFCSNARSPSDLGLWPVYWIDVQSDVVDRRRRTALHHLVDRCSLPESHNNDRRSHGADPDRDRA